MNVDSKVCCIKEKVSLRKEEKRVGMSFVLEKKVRKKNCDRNVERVYFDWSSTTTCVPNPNNLFLNLYYWLGFVWGNLTIVSVGLQREARSAKLPLKRERNRYHLLYYYYFLVVWLGDRCHLLQHFSTNSIFLTLKQFFLQLFKILFFFFSFSTAILSLQVATTSFLAMLPTFVFLFRIQLIYFR